MVTAVPKPVVERDRCPEFLDWLHWQPCCLCTRLGLRQTTSSDPAHFPRVRIHGDIRNAIPLCRVHHADHHTLGLDRFCLKYDIHFPRGLAWAWWNAFETQRAQVAW